MSKIKTKHIVPLLRFSDFKDFGDWQLINGDQIFNQISNKNHNSDLPILAITQEHGAIPRDEIDYNVSVTDKSIESYKVVDIGDFIISLRSFQGGLEYSKYKGICSPAYIVLRKKGEVVNQYFKHYFKTDGYIQNLNKDIEGIRDGKMVSYKQFSKILLPLPEMKEQQKIADCLSSIDDLITAQTKKIDALKNHKKGLMQKLFPVNGENKPSLRFSAFRDAAAWEEVTVNQLGELVSGLTYSPDDVRDSGLLVLRSSNVQNGQISLDDNVYVTPNVRGANLLKPNDILICVRNGSKTLIGKNAIIPEGMPLCTHGAFMTVFRSRWARFVFQLFQTSNYQNQVDGDLGATINSINGSQFVKYKFFVPKQQEQEKIADCLSSIDHLIVAQTQKLFHLKEHKKGLMQQLFPLIDELSE
jgi:type I restriction enzyme S subunit